ncbi:hypothetical protein [Psychrobacter sp. I-STPA6b]|uniref:hypothetical protein n=1 Tax=Psychrobacter sp. I-STPA6b TaxID=2585718 RepID=UPI001D0C2558|nr:hypothetical protein [Psychrobacter sp. I-STPA6b]
MKGYHNSNQDNLKAIDSNIGIYGGIFVTLNSSHCTDTHYGEYVYAIDFETICESSDIEDFLYTEEGCQFLADNNRTEDDVEALRDCEYAIDDDDTYRENQKIRALIAKKLGFDAVEENDGYLVVNGVVTYLGHCKSEEVAEYIENDYD